MGKLVGGDIRCIVVLVLIGMVVGVRKLFIILNKIVVVQVNRQSQLNYAHINTKIN